MRPNRRDAAPTTFAMRVAISSRTPRRWPLLVLAGIAWLAVAFNWYDSRFNIPPLETPVPEDGARLVVVSIRPVLDDANESLQLNYFIANKGRMIALGKRQQGLVVSASGLLSENDLGPLFTLLRAQLKVSSGFKSTSEIEPGRDNIFFTIPPIQDRNNDAYRSFKDGTGLVYGMTVMIYSDRNTPYGKKQYTESCVYFFKEAQHFCESGHNRTFIAD